MAIGTAAADPFVEIHHRPETVPPGGSAVRTLDCGSLVSQGGKLYLTCEAAQQIDPIGDKSTRICTDTDKPSPGPAELTGALVKTLHHFATMHGDCKGAYAKLLGKQGKDPAKVIGGNWQAQSEDCSLTAARDQCRAAMEPR